MPSPKGQCHLLRGLRPSTLRPLLQGQGCGNPQLLPGFSAPAGWPLLSDIAAPELPLGPPFVGPTTSRNQLPIALVLKPELSADSSGMHAQSCPTLWHSMHCGPPGSSVHSKNTGAGCLLYNPGDLPDSGIEPSLLCLLQGRADSLLLSHLEGSLKHRLLGSTLDCLTREVWAEVRQFAFLSSSQVMQLVLVWGLYLKNHCRTLYSLR